MSTEALTTAGTPIASRPRKKRVYEPEDILVRNNSARYELVDGQRIAKAMGMKSSYYGTELTGRLRDYCKSLKLGMVNGADQSYQCFPEHPKRVRIPDVSFISFARLRAKDLVDGHCRIVPDFVVEVVSPKDLFDDVEARIHDFLTSGTRLAWVVMPRHRLVRVYHRDGANQDHGGSEVITCEDVIPGFSISVAELFTLPELPPE